METERSAITEQVLNLTLEILYLLTGEDYIIVKKPGGKTAQTNRLQVVEGICRTLGNVLLTPPQPVTAQHDNEQKIVQLSSKIIVLLTEEVPIRCQDVAVYFSMDEWEYLEGHKDRYNDILMESPQNTVLTDDPLFRNRLFDDVTSDLLNEDDIAMDTDSGTACLQIHNPREMQMNANGTITEKTSGCESGNLADVDYKYDPSIRIKEEPCDNSWDGGNLPDITTHAAAQCHSLHVKEEPVSYNREKLPDPNSDPPPDHTQDRCAPITLVPVSCSRQTFIQPNFYITTAPPQYAPTPNSKDPTSCVRGNLTKTNIYTPREPPPPYPHPPVMEKTVSCDNPTDPKPHQYPMRQIVLVKETASHNERKSQEHNNTVKESSFALTLSDESKTKVDHEKNKSSFVYSVRQKEDAMEILYHCPTCYKGFNRNLDLVRHQVIHTVDKLFICSICKKSFTQMSFLVKHQVIHTDLKLCVCPVCAECFYSQTSLSKHLKGHSLPMYCTTCGKCFLDRSEFESHQRKHAAEKP